MSKKQFKMSQRPVQPTNKEIMEDLEQSSSTDIAFSLSKDIKTVETPLESTNLLTESVACQEDVSGVSSAANNTPDNGQGKSEVNMDTLYKEAVQFLHASEQLRDAPNTLKTKCDQLMQLDKELKESIDLLKTQSQSVLET